MRVTINANDELMTERTYHVNPYNVVGVYERNGVCCMDTTDGRVYRIDRDSYDRIVAWMEWVR